MSVAVIVNANARRHRRQPGLARDYARIGAHVVHTHSLDDLPAAIAELRGADVHTVALSGGDGAVHRGLTALARGWDGPLPRIALLPAGTMNTVARGLGVRGTPQAVLQRAASPDAPTVVRCPIDAGEQRLGFLVGTGFWARFLHEYDARSGPGPVRAAGVLAQGLASTAVRGAFVRDLFEPVTAQVSLDGQTVPGSVFTMVAAGAVPSVGLGFSPFKGIEQLPEAFHALAFQSTPGRVARQLPTLFRGGAPVSPDVGKPVRRLQMRSEAPFLWAIDGDVQPPTHTLELSVGPELSIVV